MRVTGPAMDGRYNNNTMKQCLRRQFSHDTDLHGWPVVTNRVRPGLIGTKKIKPPASNSLARLMGFIVCYRDDFLHKQVWKVSVKSAFSSCICFERSHN